MKHLATLSTDRLRGPLTEFRIGLRCLPYLADHGFQDIVVLPGSFYIDMVLAVDHEVSKGTPRIIKNATFHNLISLTAEDIVIKVDVTEQIDGRVEYTFYEAGVENGSTRSYAAKLEIDRNQWTSLKKDDGGFSIEVFQAQAHTVIDSEQFYKTLRGNGNQYGPRFRNVSSIWLADNQCLGRISVSRQTEDIEPPTVHPIVLDSMTQLLAPFVMERGKTFILRSIEKITITDINFPDTLWGHATLLSTDTVDERGLLGNVRLLDHTGKQYLELSGVAFALLDHVDSAAKKPEANLLIASNFTAEPLKDSLKFWTDYFDVPAHIEFAPFNQILQQLLDTESAFSRNSDGVNVVLLSLEEWAVRDRHALMNFDKERAERFFADRPRYVLPNGLEIVHLNQYETEYVYKEIFEDRCYLRHGICLRDGATVIDIGANIGLFSLFVMSQCANPKIYAFEPAPVVYDLLKANCAAHGSNVHAFNLGVSDRPKNAPFTFYEKSSVFSGFHSDESEDRAAIQMVVRNMLKSKSLAGESLEEYVRDLTADRVDYRIHECQLTSVSDFIRENQIEKIDLLKIDAEKSELDILEGIEDCDWPKIDQIVIEIHDRTGDAVKRIEELIREKGYRCVIEHEKLLEHSGLFNLYAMRAQADEVRPPASALKRNVQDFCTALRFFMTHATAPLVLGICPASPAAESNAELKAALNDAEEALSSEAAAIANVHAISAASILQHYPVSDYYDPESQRVGHIPYTPECYAAIGTALIRTISHLKRDPYKVIVLDCDNTLWKGICGEDGPLGIELTAPYRVLQQFMVGQMNAGMLLCLCSKNNEQDVLDVFERRADMLLKREHLVSWRVNWKSKSENIRSLAQELNLGLDSFIFVDDNPIDCAEVKNNCPDVLTLQLPQNPESFASFLNHIWAFDHARSTEEDQNRTRMYQESAQRRQYLEQSFSLKDFIKGLDLRLEIAEATENQLGRISQQTFRTNQFNFTTVRRAETEITAFLQRKDAACLVARVADRFGDYGLVGVLMYEAAADHYKVDTLLLSCRVLGRGVEHGLVSWLGQRAVKEGKKFVEFTYVPTGKNLPALEFITAIGDQYRNESGNSWSIPAEYLANIKYEPNERAPIECRPILASKPELTLRPALSFGIAERSSRLQQIGEKLCDIDRLAKAIEEYRLRKQPRQTATDSTPGNALETILANIWKKVLGQPQIGINDNFFEVGGSSLRAVQVIAQIKKELKQKLSLVALFECPTVKLLAAKLAADTEAAGGDSRASAAARRGQQRRYNTMRQSAS